jgi:hypothetical protein
MHARRIQRPSRLIATSLGVALATVAAAAAAGCGDDDDDVDEIAFPADYAATYTEVRDCRASGDHDLNNIRVLTDPAATTAYQGRTQPFPIGAIVLKEEHDFADVDCTGPVTQWTVMQRLADDSSPTTLDWRWQRVDRDRNLATEDDPRCFNCHVGCGNPPDGYDGTCTIP